MEGNNATFEVKFEIIQTFTVNFNTTNGGEKK